jgi:hypothetical protein
MDASRFTQLRELLKGGSALGKTRGIGGVSGLGYASRRHFLTAFHAVRAAEPLRRVLRALAQYGV